MNQSPFKLLEAYGAGDKDIFFGRDSEVYALYNLLQQTQLALVYGASGTGKTSLINAGLPRVFKMADWFKVAVRRRDNINDALCTAIGSHLGTKPTPSELPEAVRQVFERRWIPVYLVFDQFEELFTLGQDEEERVLFFQTLRDILAQNTAVKVVLTMREEYIGHLYDYEHILPNLFDKRFRVEAMKDDTICTVISRTCRVHSIPLENGDDTARAILLRLKTGKQAVQLPYLQIYLHALYLKAAETMPRVRFTYALVGLEEHSLERVLNRFISGKMAEAQTYLQEKHPGIPANLAEAILDDFATEAGTKRALRVQDIVAKHSQPAQVIQDALRYFDEKARLLRADEDDVSRYEPVHDVVARQIHELRSAEDKEYRTFLRELETAHARWLQDGKPTERLLPEIDLLRVEGYAARLAQRPEYQMEWAAYVTKSRNHIEAVKRRKRALNMVLVAVTVLAVVAAGVAGFNYWEANKSKQLAEEKTIQALEAEKQATESARLAEDEKQKAIKAREEADESARLANIEEQKAMEAQKEAEAERNKVVQTLGALERANESTVHLLLKDADFDILNLRYEQAGVKIVSAEGLGALKQEVSRAYLELVFWYGETGDEEQANTLLKKATALQNRILPANLSTRDAIQQLDTSTYDTLMIRYYPDMVPIQGGEFLLGCDVERDPECTETGVPRKVSDFQMARYETTVWQFALFCKAEKLDITKHLEPTWIDPGNNPIVNVDWYDAVAYANWVSERRGLKAIIEKEGDKYNLKQRNGGYRLPSEAEWEYAARAGQATVYAGSNDLDSVGWYDGNSQRRRTEAVGQKKSNAFGLYDMSGNVMEWCWDWYGDYGEELRVDYFGPDWASYRVYRGGSWFGYAGRCRAAFRDDWLPASRYTYLGFRLALSLEAG